MHSWDFESLLLSEGIQQLSWEEAPLHTERGLAPLGCGCIRKGVGWGWIEQELSARVGLEAELRFQTCSLLASLCMSSMAFSVSVISPWTRAEVCGFA